MHLELACPNVGEPLTSPQLERLGPPLARTLGLSLEGLLEAFRPATAADGPAIFALRRAVIGNALWWDDEQFVRWRYFDAEFGGHPRPCWVLTLGNEIVGFVGLEPVVLVVDGRPYEATRTLDIMVRRDFEGRGIGGFMNLVLLQRFPVSMVTGSNAESHRLIGRSWQHILDLCGWKLPIASSQYLDRHLGRIGSMMLAPAADWALALDRRRRRSTHPSLEIREIAAFDESLTSLSAQVEGPGQIGVRRSPDYLNWRYFRNPRCAYRVVAGLLDGVLAGYVVTRFNLRRPNPGRQAEIVDWLALPGPEAGSSPLDHLLGQIVSGRLEFLHLLLRP